MSSLRENQWKKKKTWEKKNIYRWLLYTKYKAENNGRNGPESAARACGAICRTVKSVQMIQSAKRE